MAARGGAESPVSPFSPISIGWHGHKLNGNSNLLCLLGIGLRRSRSELWCRGVLHLRLETVRVTGFSEEASSALEILPWRHQRIPSTTNLGCDKIIRSLESSVG